MIDILLPVFLLSLVLLGIHSYFGLEIINRGIIFTDLAVGQMAAVGAGISLFFFDGSHLYVTSLFFAIVGALLISLATRRVKYLEAFIGLLYAFGISFVFILMSRSAHGMEEFHQLMAADILFTALPDILKAAVFYVILGIVIYIFNKKTSGFLKEVLFFLTFSLTVTTAVKLAGVLVVFAILISPAVIAKTIGRGNLIIVAWITGTIINLGAIIVSYNFDFPTGYTLVFLHSIFAIAFTLIKKSRAPESPC